MQSFSGVGAQHQNAEAERSIQTVMYMARSFMIHAALHWGEDGADKRFDGTSTAYAMFCSFLDFTI